MIIFTRLPDVSMSRNRVRPASSSLYLNSYEYRSHHDIVDRNFACLTFPFEANLGSSGSGRVESRRSKNVLCVTR